MSTTLNKSTHPLTHPEALTPLVLTNESQTDLDNLRQAWQSDYPGTTQTITTLLEDLVEADWERRRARLAIRQFQTHIDRNTALPTYLWGTRELTRLTHLQKHLAQVQRQFHRALKTLQACYKPSDLKVSNKPEPPPPPPPGPPPKGTLNQNIAVTVVNGETKSKIDFDAAFWIKGKLWENADVIARQFYFADAVIPAEYQYVLSHRGGASPPLQFFTIYYKPDEFARLCYLELESKTSHVLDGARAGYVRDEFELARYEKIQQEKNRETDPHRSVD